MAIIETKYSLGDTVYFATTTTSKKTLPCPDCLGSRKWEATSPAGRKFTFACPRCSTNYQSKRELSLNYTTFDAHVEKRTIGSIKASNTPGDYDYPATYMCHETGIGSGNLYNETKLFPTYDEAMVAAKAMADKANNGGVPWVAEQYNATLELSDYQLDDAREKIAERALSKLSWEFRDFKDSVRTCESMKELAELLEAEDA